MRNLLSCARSRWASRIGVKLGTVITLLIGGISLFILLYFPSRLDERATRALSDRPAVGRVC